VANSSSNDASKRQIYLKVRETKGEEDEEKEIDIDWLPGKQIVDLFIDRKKMY